jgi:hypothetical protein
LPSTVTDRLAYLNFVHGSLATSLAVKLDGARAPFKNLRDTEAALTPRRNIRAGLQLQLNRIEHDQPKGLEKRTAELKEQLRKLNLEDQPQETEVELLKRQAVRESEQQKWDAIREVCFASGNVCCTHSLFLPLVWREARSALAGCNTHYCRVAHLSPYPCPTLHRWTGHWCHARISTARS